MSTIEMLKVIILGIVEGITEWLPVSSTGHMILVDEFLKLDVSPEFREMFLVVIQLGAIMAVIVLFWNKIFPFRFKKRSSMIDFEIMTMWFKIIVATIPAGVIGVLFDDYIDEHFYNYLVVAVALVVYGVLFIKIENYNKNKKPVITNIEEMTYKAALWIGICQMLAAIVPGTSRSGATILGAILIGISRTVAAEFTFYLAIPVMIGASFVKIVKFGFHITAAEGAMLCIGMLVAFLVSIVAIRFLMSFVKKHDFKVFGWYRIILGSIVLLYFGIFIN